MKIFANIFKIVAMTITVAAIVVCAIIMGPTLKGVKPFVAQSGSMEPEIGTGSLVYIDTQNKDVKVGDIIAYKIHNEIKNKDIIVTHRIVREENGNFITQGDVNKLPDASPVSKGQIIGKYAYNIPKLGLLYDKVGQKFFVVVAAWIFILVGLSVLLSFLAEKDQKECSRKTESIIAA